MSSRRADPGPSAPPRSSAAAVEVGGAMRVSGEAGAGGGVPSGPGALLDIRELQVEYLIPGKGPDAAVRAVDGVSFTIAPGEVFGLAGESGSGKSTIAHSILRVLRPPAIITGGEILFKGRDVLEMGEGEVASLQRREVATLTPQDFDPQAES